MGLGYILTEDDRIIPLDPASPIPAPYDDAPASIIRQALGSEPGCRVKVELEANGEGMLVTTTWP